MKSQSQPDLLLGIKILKTAIPFACAWRQFRLAAILTALVLVECAVLLVNSAVVS